MSERTSYEPGTPCWVDLGSPDPDASAAFYGGLFGWETAEAGPAEETGGYRMFTLGGKAVAGVGPLMNEGQPAVWSTYVSVDDAAATVARATGAGGSVVVEPTPAMDAGHFAFFTDTVGAAVGVWQPGRHAGCELVNEPGALTWNELACRDPEAARPFYEAVFGWKAETAPMGEASYTTWSVADRPVAGMIQMTEQWPPEVPSHWMTYFAVEDCEAATNRAGELGATTLAPPTEIEVGTFAALSDPNGSAFSVIRLNEAPD